MTDKEFEQLWQRVTGFSADDERADIAGFAREVERLTLERAAQVAWDTAMSNHTPGKEINRRVLGGYITNAIRALVEPK